VGFDVTAPLMRQAQVLAMLEDAFAVTCAADIRTLVQDALVEVAKGIKAGHKLAAALAPAGGHHKLLTLVAAIDYDRLAAALPGAKALVAKAKQAEADKLAKQEADKLAKQAKAAEREAKAAKLAAPPVAITPAKAKAMMAFLAQFAA
jgi:hypothetical protein